VLSSKTYKNNGTEPLFKFLGNCLIGSFEDAKPYIPNKIRLLKNTSSGALGEKNVNPSSFWRTLAKAPAISSDADTKSAKVIYSFEIPRSEITDDFNQVALYGADTDDYTDFSAYYYLTDESGDLDLVDATEWSTTTILLIDWELSLSNKNVEVNNMQGGQT
jgi:hypothetical protein